MPTLAEILRNYKPPVDSALADSVSEYVIGLPQQIAQGQQALDKTVGGWNKTDFGTGQPNPNYYPKAIGELTQSMPIVAGTTKAIKSGANLIPEAYKEAFEMEAKTGYRPNESEMQKIMKIQEMMANERELRKQMLAKQIGKL